MKSIKPKVLNEKTEEKTTYDFDYFVLGKPTSLNPREIYIYISSLF